MFTAGKTSAIADEMRKYKVSFLGLCETRWLQTGEVKLDSGESILYSRHANVHTGKVFLAAYRVEFMLSKEAQRALISFEPNSGFELAMGKQGLGIMNGNGERFADMCADYNLVIGGTIFPHKPIPPGYHLTTIPKTKSTTYV